MFGMGIIPDDLTAYVDGEYEGDHGRLVRALDLQRVLDRDQDLAKPSFVDLPQDGPVSDPDSGAAGRL